MKVFNRGVDINVSNEDALKVNGTQIIDKDGKIYGDIHAAAGSIGTAELADGGVTTDKLATGIKPSHIVKFFVDGSTITGTALEGLAVGDLVVTITAAGEASVAVCAVEDTLPAGTADTDYLIVFRAAA